jgi:hypothetical protein
MFLFSSFDLCMGVDLFGKGAPVLVTSMLAIVGSLSTLLFALNPMEMHRRTVTLILVTLTLAMRVGRALAISDVVLEMDAGGWIATTLIALGPPAAILVVALAFPPPRTTDTIIQDSLLPTDRDGS